MNEWIVIRTNAKKCLCAHGRTDLCEQREVDGVIKRQRRHGCRECSSVHYSEVLLFQQGQWLNMMLLERFFAGHNLACAKDARTIEHPNIADASNGSGNICQRGEILNAD